MSVFLSVELVLQEHVNGDSLNLLKEFLPDGLKGQHDLKLIPAGGNVVSFGKNNGFRFC